MLFEPKNPQLNQELSGYIGKAVEALDDPICWEGAKYRRMARENAQSHLNNLEDVVLRWSECSPLIALEASGKENRGQVCWSFILESVLQLQDCFDNPLDKDRFVHDQSGIEWLVQIGYEVRTDVPSVGDMVLYYSKESDIIGQARPTHYAVIDMITPDGQIFCLSKWESGPIVFHELSTIPEEYGEKAVFLTLPKTVTRAIS